MLKNLAVRKKIGLVAIDEAHLVQSWRSPRPKQGMSFNYDECVYIQHRGHSHVKSTQKIPDPLRFGRNLVLTYCLLRHLPIVSFSVICCMASELEPAKKLILCQILAYLLVLISTMTLSTINLYDLQFAPFVAHKISFHLVRLSSISHNIRVKSHLKTDVLIRIHFLLNALWGLLVKLVLGLPWDLEILECTGS